MTPVQEFLIFCLQVAACSLFSSFLINRFAQDVFPAFAVRWAGLLSFTTFFLLGTLDQVLIYPHFRSPLRHLPTYKHLRFGNTITESPRGKTALQWMKEHQDAEMIRVLGPCNVPVVILSGAASLRDVLNTRPYDFEKFQGIAAFLARVIGYGLILSEGNPHRVQRKALTPSFQIRKIRGLYDLMWEKTGILLAELKKDIDEHRSAGDSGYGRVEMAEWASRLTLDIIGPTAMGRDFQSLTHKDNEVAEAYLEILDPSMERLAFLGLHMIMPEWIIRRIPWSVNRMIDDNCGFLRNLARKIVIEKKHEILSSKGEAKENDILSSIIQTEQFNDDEIVDQMLTFLAAGHETTAAALAWSCYLCAKHPDIQEKLRAEIRQRIPSSDAPITYDVLESMPYLNGVCEETQRLYPTVPATVRMPIVDTVVAGVPMPKGTRILLIQHAINRHPKFWGASGDDFVPERWIDKLDDGSMRPNKHGGASTNFAEITFLHGPRSCIGRDFAKAELRCAVAGIIGKFHVELQNPDFKPTVRGVVTTKPAEGMNLLMKPVDGW